MSGIRNASPAQFQHRFVLMIKPLTMDKRLAIKIHESALVMRRISKTVFEVKLCFARTAN